MVDGAVPVIDFAWLTFLVVCAEVIVGAVTLLVVFACWFAVDRMLAKRRSDKAAERREADEA